MPQNTRTSGSLATIALLAVGVAGCIGGTIGEHEQTVAPAFRVGATLCPVPEKLRSTGREKWWHVQFYNGTEKPVYVSWGWPDKIEFGISWYEGATHYELIENHSVPCTGYCIPQGPLGAKVAPREIPELSIHPRQCATWHMDAQLLPLFHANRQPMHERLRISSGKREGSFVVPAPDWTVLGQTLKEGEEPTMITAASLNMNRAGVLPALISVLEDKSSRFRAEAACALCRVQPPPREALAALVKALDDKDSPVYLRHNITPALSAIGEPALPPLIKALGDHDWCVRMGAAEGLGQLGPAAADAVPALQKSLHDEVQHVRDAAREALERIRNGGASGDIGASGDTHNR